MGNNSDMCQDPDKVIFNFLSYNFSDNAKIVLYKGLRFAIPPKTIEYYSYWRYSFQKVDEDNNIVILNRSDYISTLSSILEDTSKFERVNIKEGKALIIWFTWKN